MSTLINKFDTLESLIFNEGVRITRLDFHPDVDLLLVILNTGSVLQERLSDHSRLSGASLPALNAYRLIGKGTGVHWPELDEDLSLKGLLASMIKRRITQPGKTA
jgi:hypothetical protein